MTARGHNPIRSRAPRGWKGAFVNGSIQLFGLAGTVSTTGLVVIVILSLLSVWSLGVSLARGVRATAPARLFPYSHVARVVAAGLSTFQQKSSRGLSPAEVIEATGRA